MTQYILEVSSYVGLVPWAQHFKGRVKGPSPESCHGGTRFNGQDGPLKGKTTCFEGHELPGRVEWEVEAAWTEEQYDRWVAKNFEGDGPSQFGSKTDVISRAIEQFLDGSGSDDRYWEEKVEPAQEGDELWHGWIALAGRDDDMTDESDGWGTCIARKSTG